MIIKKYAYILETLLRSYLSVVIVVQFRIVHLAIVEQLSCYVCRNNENRTEQYQTSQMEIWPKFRIDGIHSFALH